jgi:hypothetical protein
VNSFFFMTIIKHKNNVQITWVRLFVLCLVHKTPKRILTRFGTGAQINCEVYLIRVYVVQYLLHFVQRRSRTFSAKAAHRTKEILTNMCLLTDVKWNELLGSIGRKGCCQAAGVGVGLAADIQSTSSSWYRAALWGPWPDFIFLFFFRLTITLLFFLGRHLWWEDGPVVYSAIADWSVINDQ